MDSRRNPLTSTRAAVGFTIIAAAGWCGWVLVNALVRGQGRRAALLYLIPPVVAGAGIVVGRIAAAVQRRFPVAEVVAALTLLMMLSTSFYANAEAATGVQLVALSALLLLSTFDGGLSERRAARSIVAALVTLTLGVLLAARSDAAAILAVVLVATIAYALVRRQLAQLRVGVGAVVAILVAALTNIGLGLLRAWPAWLAESQALSQARHTLWRDALRLWRDHPLAGGGPGSFVGYSELATSRSSLERVHSSLLQLGSELGIVGVALFGLLLLAGLLIAARGSLQAAVIGMLAWTALAIHSFIDHLYEYPTVVLTAGIVLGWAASTQRRP
ncbi:MAG: O-antigen ligase family protein [Propionibacterium sp.]|nr:O-antigen ligase family protein [Propionibacterium sp.]